MEVSEIVDRYLKAVTSLRQQHTDYFLAHCEVFFGKLLIGIFVYACHPMDVCTYSSVCQI